MPFVYPSVYSNKFTEFSGPCTIRNPAGGRFKHELEVQILILLLLEGMILLQGTLNMNWRSKSYQSCYHAAGSRLTCELEASGRLDLGVEEQLL
jgi:hypothetical protein